MTIAHATWSAHKRKARAAPLAPLAARLLELGTEHARALDELAHALEPVFHSDGEEDHVHLAAGTVSTADVRAALYPPAPA